MVRSFIYNWYSVLAHPRYSVLTYLSYSVSFTLGTYTSSMLTHLGTAVLRPDPSWYSVLIHLGTPCSPILNDRERRASVWHSRTPCLWEWLAQPSRRLSLCNPAYINTEFSENGAPIAGSPTTTPSPPPTFPINKQGSKAKIFNHVIVQCK